MSQVAERNTDWFSAVYYGVRAYCCERPSDVAEIRERLEDYFEKSRKTYLGIKKTGFSSKSLKPGEAFKYFATFFLQFQNILFTRIGYDELESVCTTMLLLLTSHLKALPQAQNHKMEANLLSYIVLITLFSLYNQVFQYKGSENSPKDGVVKDLDRDEITRECLRYGGAILSKIFHARLLTLDDAYVNVFLPVMYFLVSNTQFTTHFKTHGEGFRTGLDSLLRDLTNSGQEIPSEESQRAGKQEFAQCILLMDRFLLGFRPLTAYFTSAKTEAVVSKRADSRYLLTLLLLELGADPILAELAPESTLTRDEEDEEVKDHLEILGQMSANVRESREKNLIVIDGQNVAVRYGGDRFRSKGIKLAVEYWQQRGHAVQVILPDFCFQREEVLKRQQTAESMDLRVKNIPDDVDLLLAFQQKKIAFGIPNWNYDDSYIIDYAMRKEAFIVTNDRYNDHIEKFSNQSAEKRKMLQKWIRGNCISFAFIGDDFMPNPEFLNAHHIK
eukprot:TRINITY_DN12867_c0_g1_i2.p1 TRINITY_DN12867_c0_g1~~TRINITY_DN12867_c0_g1_i2.p1  ORF type:complete len:501 (+),score=87.67 TRINITY_DN12867_c0_g1_i2:731-2233(+)